jgi:hypothetical protein
MEEHPPLMGQPILVVVAVEDLLQVQAHLVALVLLSYPYQQLNTQELLQDHQL